MVVLSPSNPLQNDDSLPPTQLAEVIENAAVPPEQPTPPSPEPIGRRLDPVDNTQATEASGTPVDPPPTQEAAPAAPDDGGPPNTPESFEPPNVRHPNSDAPDYVASSADMLLQDIYGDYVHANSGTQLDGGIEDDKLWQRRWRRIVEFQPYHYTLPQGKVGRRFLKLLDAEFQGIMDRTWNGERVIAFCCVILQTDPSVNGASSIRTRLTHRMDLWEKGLFAALVDDTVGVLRLRAVASPPPHTDESRARRFDRTLKQGRIRVATRTLTNRGSGGVLELDATDPKTGLSVLETLRAKNPPLRDIDVDDPLCTSFEDYDAVPHIVPQVVDPCIVEEVAAKLRGGAGPSGVDAIAFQSWLLRFGDASGRLRRIFAKLGTWMANEIVDYAAIRAFNAAVLVPLDKNPGTRPICKGEIFRRCWAKCGLEVNGFHATSACGTTNLCAGLKSGIEGAVHAMRDEWDEAWDRENPDFDGEVPPPLQSYQRLLVDEAEEDDEEDFTLNAGVLFDADNGFNNLSRKAMLWTVRHRWPHGATFAYNFYRHSALLLVRERNGNPATVLLNSEGVHQGCPFSMVLYGVGLLPLGEKLETSVPDTMQTMYADDFGGFGPVSGIGLSTDLLLRHGPFHGYYVNTGKSVVVCRTEYLDACRTELSGYNFRYSNGERYLGGYLGEDDTRDEWAEGKIAEWCDAVSELARVAAPRYPQSAYAALLFSLQHEWQYMQRVLPLPGELFQPLEDVIRSEFIPALLGSDEKVPDDMRELMCLSSKVGGCCIPDPTKSGTFAHRTSRHCTERVTLALINGTKLDVVQHNAVAKEQAYLAHCNRIERHTTALRAVKRRATAKARRRYERNEVSGAWLTTLPSYANNTDLSATEFRDGLRLRLGLEPLNMPDVCDGCGAKFTIEHACSCKVGGLIHLRHDTQAKEYGYMCSRALTPSAVTSEPLVSRAREVNRERVAAAQPGEPVRLEPELRADVGVVGFWAVGKEALFDIRITDADSPSYRGRSHVKILESQEKEKKDKYLPACEAQRKSFTPLVFTIDGCRSIETIAACKRLARLLSEKWDKQYSKVSGYINSRLSLALVRMGSRCIRGARNPTRRMRYPAWECGAGLALYR